MEYVVGDEDEGDEQGPGDSTTEPPPESSEQGTPPAGSDKRDVTSGPVLEEESKELERSQQRTSVTVTLLGIGKGVTVANCHSIH